MIYIPQVVERNPIKSGTRFGNIVVLKRVADHITPSNRRLPRYLVINSLTGQHCEVNRQNLEYGNNQGKNKVRKDSLVTVSVNKVHKANKAA